MANVYATSLLQSWLSTNAILKLKKYFEKAWVGFLATVSSVQYWNSKNILFGFTTFIFFFMLYGYLI